MIKHLLQVLIEKSVNYFISYLRQSVTDSRPTVPQ